MNETSIRYSSNEADAEIFGLQRQSTVAIQEFPDKPYQLIDIDDNGLCRVDMEALKLLAKIDTQVAIVTVAGAYRTGKSYLLNRLIGRQDGFELGSTVNSCTKGIWMWGRPLKINENLHVVFLDTEGLHSFNRNQQIDIKIFSLAILLSSFFIFNSMGAINENALESLGLVVNLSKYIHVKTKPKNVEEDSSLFSQYFPSFLWVVRDFTLQLVNTENQEIDSKQYLENSLRPVDNPNANESVTQKNEIRNTISAFFRERDCATLVIPVSDEDKLRKINTLPYESLRPVFRSQLEALIKKVFLNIRPKSVEGQPLNGSMFAHLLQQYVNAMNSDEVPTISTAWERVVETELKKTFRAATDKYESIMEKNTLNRMPMEQKEYTDIEKQARDEAFKIINSLTVVNAPLEKVLIMRERFLQRVNEINEKLTNDNTEASQSGCQDLLRKYHEKIANKLNEGLYQAHRDLSEDWETFRKMYFDSAVGPAKLSEFSSFSFEHIFDDYNCYLHSLDQESKKKVTELEHQISLSERIATTAKEALAKEKERNSMNLDSLKAQHQERRVELEGTITDLKMALETKDDIIQRLQIDTETQKFTMNELQKQVKSLKRKKSKGNKQEGDSPNTITGSSLSMNGIDTNGIKEMVENLMGNLKQSEIDKLKLKIEMEYEEKMREKEEAFMEQLNFTKKEQKKMFDGSLETLKRSYEAEIKSLKTTKKSLIKELNDLKRELTKKEGDVLLLQEKVKSLEKEKSIQLEHAQLLMQLTKSLKGFADSVDDVKQLVNEKNSH